MDSVYTESIFSFTLQKGNHCDRCSLILTLSKHNKCLNEKTYICQYIKVFTRILPAVCEKSNKDKIFTISGYEQSCLLTEYCGDRVLYHDIYIFPISIPYIESKLPK